MRAKALAILGSTLLVVSGCSLSDLNGVDVGTAISGGADLVKAATLSDDDVKAMALSFSQTADKQYKVAPASSPYAKRLAKLTARHKSEGGLKLDFKVYISKEVNAFALANGSIRVHSALMDMMNDQELLFVIGHEIGHVHEGHSKSAMRTAYAASAARKGVATQTGSVAGQLAAGVIGEMLEEVLNAQYSQSQESSSDAYGLEFMKRGKYNQKAAVSALKKLAKLGDESGILQSHPAPSDRAADIEAQIASGK